MHAADDDELADAVMTDLAVMEMRRDDAGDATAAQPGGIGQAAHEADPTAAIDELDASRRKPRAELDGGLAIDRIDEIGGAAIDAEALHCSHGLLPVAAAWVIAGRPCWPRRHRPASVETSVSFR